MSDGVYNIMIIGSGPAGLTAAIYASRAQLGPVVFEGTEPGGQLTATMEIENFPGFPDGLKGEDLMQSFRRQAERFGARIIPKTIEKVDLLERPFRAWDGDGQLYRSHAVIIATGSSYKWLGLDSEQKLLGHGVSFCATCDGYFFREKEIAVVGGGDTAMEEALFLARLGSKVTVIHRRNQFRASKIMGDRVMEHPKIGVKWNSSVEEILGDPETTGVTGVRIRNTSTHEEEVVPCAGLFVAIGRSPNTAMFQGVLDMDRNGYLVTGPGNAGTSIEGVFACGEAQDNTYRQAITSAGSGAMAAIDAERWLAEIEVI
ncbi:MAG: thioredoxin-disulfide reductase [Nitrospiraceae bacterium]|nr:thioredoxin-disulfide reductase [Nitrospiraceae bacterium]